MGDTERAQMLLDLEKTTKELNELSWKAAEIGKALEKLGHFLKTQPGQVKPTPKDYPHLKDIIDFNKITETTQQIANLESKKRDLEKKLGVKLTTPTQEEH